MDDVPNLKKGPAWPMVLLVVAVPVVLLAGGLVLQGKRYEEPEDNSQWPHATKADYDNIEAFATKARETTRTVVGGLGIFLILLGGGVAAGPKVDRRFRTGYKNNEVPNWPLQVAGAGVLALGLFFIAVAWG
jgi:hypothetical protein